VEYYIRQVPVFMVEPMINPDVDIAEFCNMAKETIPEHLLINVEVVYIGNFKDLENKNAAFANGGIYMTNSEPTVYDMLENFVHEVAHSLESTHARSLYSQDSDLVDEFRGKRTRLYHLLKAQGYHINPRLYSFLEYNKKFDNFLANEVGYPTLLSLTLGLFCSPYGATSIQEYFANGFEKYYLDSPRTVRDVSPVLYRKIEEIINDDEA